MKTIYKSLICLGIVGISLSACNDDALFQEPVSEISGSSFWKTENDAQAGLRGMYVRLRGQAATNLFLWGEARSEAEVASFGIDNGTAPIFQNTVDAARPGPTWVGLYTVIHDANLLLKNVPEITFRSEAEKNDILAQAHAMRAYVYFVMARTWGGVPLVTEPTASFDPQTTNKERASVEAIFALIKEDLDKAIALFPDYSFSSGRSLWSKGAVQVLKADVYLWTGKRLGGGDADFNAALTALTEAETNADVALLDDFGSVFDYSNKGNQEIMMAIRFRELEAPQTFFQNMYISGVFMPQNTDQATLDAIGVPGGLLYWEISPAVVAQFSDEDQRKDASFIEIYEYDDANQPVYYSAVPRKFDGVISAGVRMFYDDVVLYRYADLLLLKAEAKNALGQDPSTEMNQIRERAYGAEYPNHVFVNGTQAENDVAILDERLKEFLLEGKYWWDLIRFGKVFERVPSLQNEEYKLLFPISEGALSLNPKLRQNPGYGGE